ncbi:MAG: FtsW/RodA/SpoVE family cell cycle protein, partial [Gammaproteobacteria bacterium]|nr:FtsW/RodA/SpoVE family cell cycle protein [Gammaproteobacteria bacterium]
MSIGFAITPGRIQSNENSMMDGIDPVLLAIVIALLAMGLVMVASSSITVADRQLHSPFYYLQRQSMAAGLGVLAILFMLKVRLVYWEKS